MPTDQTGPFTSKSGLERDSRRLIAAFALMLVTLPAQADNLPPLPPAAALPADANTKNPEKPFYVDLTGLDFSTNPPTRNPHNPAYPKALELKDGELPPAKATGNFIIGPTHAPAPEARKQLDVSEGRLLSFLMTSDESMIYRPGIAREEASLNTALTVARTEPGDPSKLIVASLPASWTRPVNIYVPAGLSADQPAPFMVIGDGQYVFGGGKTLATVLDNLIAQKRIPPMVAILVGEGGQDAQGSQRGREYDTVSGTYAQWIESEILPRVEREAGIRLTRDPDGRAAVGISSSGAVSFTMAWFRPDLYHRVLAYSPSFVNQQWPHDPALPGGAWEYHSPWTGPAQPNLATRGVEVPSPTTVPTGSPLLASNDRKPIRFWFVIGDRDVFYPVSVMADGMHDWVLGAQNMAKALAAKDYEYQFIFARNAGHVDHAVIEQTLPAAIEWLWDDFDRATAR